MDRSKMVAKSLLPQAAASASTHSNAATIELHNPTPAPTTSSAVAQLMGAAAATASQYLASTSTAGPDVASTSADAAAGSAGAMMLVDSKHTAFTFDPKQAPASTFMFKDVDYKQMRKDAGLKCSDQYADYAKQVREGGKLLHESTGTWTVLAYTQKSQLAC